MFSLLSVANRLFIWHGLEGRVLFGLGRLVGWVVGIVVGRCWWLVGQVVRVVMGVVGLFTCVQVVVPFLYTSLSQFV